MPSTLAQSKERKGSNFAIWQPLTQADDSSPVYVRGEIRGLDSVPHAFHIHEIGNTDGECNLTKFGYNSIRIVCLQSGALILSEYWKVTVGLCDLLPNLTVVTIT